VDSINSQKNNSAVATSNGIRLLPNSGFANPITGRVGARSPAAAPAPAAAPTPVANMVLPGRETAPPATPVNNGNNAFAQILAAILGAR